MMPLRDNKILTFDVVVALIDIEVGMLKNVRPIAEFANAVERE